MAYTSTLCNSVIKLSGNITGTPDYIQDNTLIGYNSLMVIIDGTQVNNIDNNGNTNWTFDSTTGTDRKSTRLNSSHVSESRMPSSA